MTKLEIERLKSSLRIEEVIGKTGTKRGELYRALSVS